MLCRDLILIAQMGLLEEIGQGQSWHKPQAQKLGTGSLPQPGQGPCYKKGRKNPA